MPGWQGGGGGKGKRFAEQGVGREDKRVLNRPDPPRLHEAYGTGLTQGAPWRGGLTPRSDCTGSNAGDGRRGASTHMNKHVDCARGDSTRAQPAIEQFCAVKSYCLTDATRSLCVQLRPHHMPHHAACCPVLLNTTGTLVPWTTAEQMASSRQSPAHLFTCCDACQKSCLFAYITGVMKVLWADVFWFWFWVCPDLCKNSVINDKNSVIELSHCHTFSC